MWGNGNTHSLVVGVENGTATLENSLVAYQTKYTLIFQTRNPTPWYVTQGGGK